MHETRMYTKFFLKKSVRKDRCKNNITVHHTKIDHEEGRWMEQAQGHLDWKALVLALSVLVHGNQIQ
jgi:hypothetical protein